jgi:hypothetical protein
VASRGWRARALLLVSVLVSVLVTVPNAVIELIEISTSSTTGIPLRGRIEHHFPAAARSSPRIHPRRWNEIRHPVLERDIPPTVMDTVVVEATQQDPVRHNSLV